MNIDLSLFNIELEQIVCSQNPNTLGIRSNVYETLYLFFNSDNTNEIDFNLLDEQTLSDLLSELLDYVTWEEDSNDWPSNINNLVHDYIDCIELKESLAKIKPAKIQDSLGYF